LRVQKNLIFSFLLIAIFSTSLSADATNAYPTKEFIENNKNIKIIDIRTAGEWEQTGVLENSYTITFFDERGSYNVPLFLNKLNRVVNKSEKFAIICRTGSRSRIVSQFLGANGYNIVNLKGGIIFAIKQAGIKTVKYSAK
jgi:rhodanese-related sulfurtransferase